MFWEYDSRTGRRWNVDPVVIPSISPYLSFGSNPIFFKDLLGNILEVGNTNQAKKDIKGIVEAKNIDFIEISEKGVLKLNFGSKTANQINEILSKDGGLNLLNDLSKSQKNYYYGNDEFVMLQDNSNNRVYMDFLLTHINGGNNTKSTVFNLSNNGKDSRGDKLSKYGFDGAVMIASSALYKEPDISDIETNLDRCNIVFHELAENFERTENGTNYGIAHQKAIDRENNFYKSPANRPGSPSSAKYITTITLAKANDINNDMKILILIANGLNKVLDQNEVDTWGGDMKKYLMNTLIYPLNKKPNINFVKQSNDNFAIQIN